MSARIQSISDSLVERTNEFYALISKPGENQTAFFAATRSVIGIAAIHLFPIQAIIGAATGAVMPTRVKLASDWLNVAITKLWNSMTLNQKLAATTVGLSITYMGFSLLWIPGSLFAARLGADMSLKNLALEKK